MHQYGVRDVERILKLSPETIRSLVRAGFVSPSRGPRRTLQFSFRDLIVLRAARALSLAKVPSRRILRSLRKLHRSLPAEAPLSGLRISAVGDDVVVSEGAGRWRADTGQYLLDLEVQVAAQGALRVVEHAAKSLQVTATSLQREQKAEPATAAEYFAQGADAEERGARGEAQLAYERAIALDPSHLEASINLGRLLHETGRYVASERAYREALKACGPNATLFFNLGNLLEDVNRIEPAIEAYQHAVAADPELADGHYNLARLFELTGRPQHAIRHLGQYRRLTT
jgi:tetratricopeptide (TPR) repeat protein